MDLHTDFVTLSRAEFEERPKRDLATGNQVYNYYISLFHPKSITHLLKYWGVKHLFQLNSPIFLKGEL